MHIICTYIGGLLVSYNICRDWRPIMLIFYQLCYAAMLKFLTYYAQYHAHVKELCLKSDCSIRVYHNM